MNIEQLLSLQLDISSINSANPDVHAIQLLDSGRELTPIQAEQLEKTLAAESSNWQAFLLLLGYYDQYHDRDQFEALRDRYAEKLCLFIETAPMSFLHCSLNYWINDANQQALTTTWLKQVRNDPSNVQKLDSAAKFLVIHREDYALRFWMRAQKLDPENPRWIYEIANLFVQRCWSNSASSHKNAAKAIARFAELLMLVKETSPLKYSFPNQLYVETTILEFATNALNKGMTTEATLAIQLLLEQAGSIKIKSNASSLLQRIINSLEAG